MVPIGIRSLARRARPHERVNLSPDNISASPPLRMPIRSRPPSRPSTAAAPPTREELIEPNDAFRRENAQIWGWPFQTIDFPVAKPQEFAERAAPFSGVGWAWWGSWA